MENNQLIITTSWDDGSVYDRKIVDLLKKYSIRGTFYIPKEFNYQPKDGEIIIRVPDGELKTLYAGFEIGAHSLTHAYFNDISGEQIKEEVRGSKKYLEDLTRRPVNMFCYPGGRYNEIAIEEVKKSGFVGARTTEIFKFNVENPFLMPTTINCYPFPFGSGGAKAKSRTFLRNISLALNLSLPVGSFLSWKNLAKFLFDKAQSEKGVFHLWGHSWEIEKNNMWKDLEDVLEYISNKDDAKYLINSEIIDFLKKKG